MKRRSLTSNNVYEYRNKSIELKLKKKATVTIKLINSQGCAF